MPLLVSFPHLASLHPLTAPPCHPIISCISTHRASPYLFLSCHHPYLFKSYANHPSFPFPLSLLSYSLPPPFRSPQSTSCFKQRQQQLPRRCRPPSPPARRLLTCGSTAWRRCGSRCSRVPRGRPSCHLSRSRRHLLAAALGTQQEHWQHHRHRRSNGVL